MYMGILLYPQKMQHISMLALYDPISCPPIVKQTKKKLSRNAENGENL
uniref:Uncharacterized protein n=1 Tax=Anguilla anguilla TaxID=7936 RepID=A0A0E9WJQ8_ANGAN